MRSAAGRVVGLVLILVLVMSVVGLAASQTFINKTGKTVTGIKIEFSRKVTITRHDSAFPDQSPSGRSDQFTFSGKDLRNFGRFSITWSPSFGKVVDYQWIEVAQPVKEQPVPTKQSNTKQEFKLPDPNTPPILYGDDYPGPDEPLYQPKPDEQIWLTDLEGHGDIYDNDSIKINYAPGFNASQITSIDVYRNGIRLRFLPEKFDVLTNAQMKTFDGNPAEHSPASAHTDHAIMGYEYKFKISTADHVWLFTKTVKSGFKWRPKEVWAEIQSQWNNEMDSRQYTQLVDYFRRLKRDGVTGIAFDVCFYMDSPYDNEVKILPHIDASIIPFYAYTPSNSEREKILEALTEAGLKAHVRGNIYISQKYNDANGFTWSSFIDPTNPQEFFDSYTKLWLKLVPLLNKYHVKLITPFTEMDGIEKYPDLIKAMYSKLSETFTGEMGFEEATNLMLAGTSPMQHGRTFQQMAKNFAFWNWTDSSERPMRLEYSAWVIKPVETQTDQRVSTIEKMFKQFWSIPVSYYGEKYPEDPQIWGEIGTHDVDGYVLGSDYYYSIPQSQKRSDEQERADFMCAALEASKELGIHSLNMWQFILCDSGPNWEFGWGMNIGYKLPESPEYRVITAIIAPAGN